MARWADRRPEGRRADGDAHGVGPLQGLFAIEGGLDFRRIVAPLDDGLDRAPREIEPFLIDVHQREGGVLK